MTNEIKNLKHAVFIGVGSNLNDKAANIQFAIDEIAKNHSCSIELLSSIYESVPMGEVAQDFFFNAVIKIDTKLSPTELFIFLKSIEKKAGRKKRERWGPRELDLDILFYDDLILNIDGLTIPHPGIIERDFVIEPMLEIEPEFVHPSLKVSLSNLKKKLKFKTVLAKINYNLKTTSV